MSKDTVAAGTRVTYTGSAFPHRHGEMEVYSSYDSQEGNETLYDLRFGDDMYLSNIKRRHFTVSK